MPPPPFAERRARVLSAITPGILLLPAARVALRNNDVEHEYRQDSDLFYLSGFDEPESVLVLSSGGAEPFTLFVRPRDPERETWDGARAGVEGAVEHFGANQAFSIKELPEKLPELLEGHDRLYYALGRDRGFDDLVLGAVDRARMRARRSGKSHPRTFIDPSTVVHEHRRVKSEEEIALMQVAADITGEAHVALMQHLRPGMYEYEAEALLRSIFRSRGSERPAYAPIVGSGPNATVLHYHRNDRCMTGEDLLLVDAACEFQYYAADVTRTYPVSGRFTGTQRAIYEVVLAAQLESLRATRPGATMKDVHDASVKVIAEGLVALGLIEGPVTTAIEEERYKRFFMHKTSHYLGMDVHDVGDYYEGSKHRPLEAGVVITVEPGIYVAPGDEQAPAEFRGIGVRIEDDVLVTADGARVLSDKVPKTIADVEHACSG